MDLHTSSVAVDFESSNTDAVKVKGLVPENVEMSCEVEGLTSNEDSMSKVVGVNSVVGVTPLTSNDVDGSTEEKVLLTPSGKRKMNENKEKCCTFEGEGARNL